MVSIFAGVVLGFVLNELAWWLRRRAEERKRERNVRKLLYLENEHNRRVMADYWNKVTACTTGFGGDEQTFEWYRQFAKLPLPPWGRILWDSNAGQLGDALEDAEITNTYALHTNWEQFTACRASVQNALASEDGQKVAAQYAQWQQELKGDVEAQYRASSQTRPRLQAALSAFLQQTHEDWSRCEAISKAAQANNPVRYVAAD